MKKSFFKGDNKNIQVLSHSSLPRIIKLIDSSQSLLFETETSGPTRLTNHELTLKAQIATAADDMKYYSFLFQRK